MIKNQEFNIIKKVDFKKKYIKFALCYPNVYRAGISNYAIQLIYRLLNNIEDIKCERFFFEKQKELISIETGAPLKSFDVIGFSIQYELDYFNIIKILKNSRIPILSKKRKKPLLIAGGPCVLENPVPLEQIFDFFILGDIEPVFNDLLTLIRNFYKIEEKKFLKYKNMDGFYFPNIKSDKKIKNVKNIDLDSSYHSIKQVIPVNYKDKEILGLGKSILIECSRGCKGKCNFCLIGWQNNPFRKRSLSKIKDIINKSIKINPVNKISLIGSGISYHKNLNDIAWYVANLGFNLSIPSLRADKFNDDLAKALSTSKIKQITFAPETGSDRLRNIINKKMTNEDILQAIQIAFNNGIKWFKLYFIIDLPTETNQDLEAIPHLLKKILNIGINERNLSISFNTFIPKPHTPFQWFGISNIDEIRKKIKFLKQNIDKNLRIRTSFSDPKWDRVQLFLSRGDIKISELLYTTLNYGSNLGAIRRILKEQNLSFDQLNKKIIIEKPLPWDFIDVGIEKEKLYKIWFKIEAKIINLKN